MDKTKHREQVKMSAHLGKLEFANQALHQTPDSPAVPAGAGGGAGGLVVMLSNLNSNTKQIRMKKINAEWPKANSELAEFLGVKEGTIRSHQRNHNKELIEHKDYFRRDLGIPNAPTLMTVWSKEGALKLAHYCKRSSKARAFLEQQGIQKLHINYIEGEILDIIIDALESLVDCYKQYPVEGYRVDLYLKDIELVIECDEMDHEYKDEVSERIRQRTIESRLGCKFLRFNPDKPGFKLGEILNTIFKEVLSHKLQRGPLE